MKRIKEYRYHPFKCKCCGEMSEICVECFIEYDCSSINYIKGRYNLIRKCQCKNLDKDALEEYNSIIYY